MKTMMPLKRVELEYDPSSYHLVLGTSRTSVSAAGSRLLRLELGTVI
jgi:hypothetical protein